MATDQDKQVRGNAIEILGEHAMLPDKVMWAVVMRLYDQEEQVRKTAVKALCRQRALPERLLTVVVARLEKDLWLRSDAVHILLSRHETLSHVP